MKKPALIKEKTKKNILQPLTRKSSRKKEPAVTVGAVVNDPVVVDDSRKKVKLGSVVGVCLLIVSVLYILMLISCYQPQISQTRFWENCSSFRFGDSALREHVA